MSAKKENIKEVKVRYKHRGSAKKQSSAHRKEEFLKLLENLQGIGKHVWKEDAQKYINRIRSNDR